MAFLDQFHGESYRVFHHDPYPTLGGSRHPREMVPPGTTTDGVPSLYIVVTPKYFCPQNPEGNCPPVSLQPVLSRAIWDKIPQPDRDDAEAEASST